MVKYSCSECGKNFNQKSHYDTHKNKKIPCVLKDKTLNNFIETKVKENVDLILKTKDTIKEQIIENVKENNIDDIKENNKELDEIKYNKYYVGDNIELIKKLKKETIDLIYFDPPYNTGRHFYDFDDKFKSKDDYIEFIKKRIIECHRVLKKTGTMVIHIEPKISHYFRYICDEIFGENNFKNEIVWKTGGNAKNKFQINRFHDTIIVYAKNNKNQIFNQMYFDYDDEYKKKSNVKYCNIHKKDYVTTAAYNAQPDVNPRPNLRYEWKGNEKQWYFLKEKMEKLDKDNRLEYNKNNIPRIKRFLDEMDGIPLRDIWTDINNTQSGEKINYATQKPVKLLERILKLYSNENSICMDIFAGSGTLGRASISLNRKYILFDINKNGKKIFKKSII